MKRQQSEDGRAFKFDGLNALRGVAAIGVLLAHCTSFLGNWAPSGPLAVDVFFLMSGFVIAHAYDQRLRDGLSTASFTGLRLVRFYPLYLVGLLLGSVKVAGMYILSAPAFPASQVAVGFALALLFLPAPPSLFSGGSLYPMNTPAWSLAVELIVNAGYAAFFRWLSGSALILICLTGFVTLVSLTVAGGSPLGGAVWGSVGLGYARALFAFPLGVLFYRYRHRIPKVPAPWYVAPILLAAFLAIEPHSWKGLYHLLFMVGASPLIVWIAAQPVPNRWRPLCTYLGRTSYPLYAVHVPIIVILDGAAVVLGLAPAALVSGGVVILLAGCWYLDLIDERFRRKITRRAPRQPATIAVIDRSE